uniref:Uncharacterized protein n=1 Tax=Onchocerca volvulus TaxID=6282 RepID=A0A8R1XPD0_ONCVO
MCRGFGCAKTLPGLFDPPGIVGPSGQPRNAGEDGVSARPDTPGNLVPIGADGTMGSCDHCPQLRTMPGY